MDDGVIIIISRSEIFCLLLTSYILITPTSYYKTNNNVESTICVRSALLGMLILSENSFLLSKHLPTYLPSFRSERCKIPFEVTASPQPPRLHRQQGGTFALFIFVCNATNAIVTMQGYCAFWRKLLGFDWILRHHSYIPVC
jgi:hypothetical protein